MEILNQTVDNINCQIWQTHAGYDVTVTNLTTRESKSLLVKWTHRPVFGPDIDDISQCLTVAEQLAQELDNDDC